MKKFVLLPVDKYINLQKTSPQTTPGHSNPEPATEAEAAKPASNPGSKPAATDIDSWQTTSSQNKPAASPHQPAPSQKRARPPSPVHQSSSQQAQQMIPSPSQASLDWSSAEPHLPPPGLPASKRCPRLLDNHTVKPRKTTTSPWRDR